jgi:hypothetical protein
VAAVDDLGLSVRKLWRSVAEKLQSRCSEPARAGRRDHRSVVGAEYRAHHLRPSCVPLMASPSSLGERHERNDACVDRLVFAVAARSGLVDAARALRQRLDDLDGPDLVGAVRLSNDRRLKCAPFDLVPTLQVLPRHAAKQIRYAQL